MSQIINTMQNTAVKILNLISVIRKKINSVWVRQNLFIITCLTFFLQSYKCLHFRKSIYLFHLSHTKRNYSTNVDHIQLKPGAYTVRVKWTQVCVKFTLDCCPSDFPEPEVTEPPSFFPSGVTGISRSGC